MKGMDIKLEPGTYVVAVSGGVDSAALLHALHDRPGLKLVVAHFDHGIREESAEDRVFVQQLAAGYGLPFVYDEGRLGAGASEAAARTARYDFLGRVRRASGARAIITAHHQDDLLETAILNMLRGTGRKGLTALASRRGLERPLLQVPKSTLAAYAREQGLKWREDATNADPSYLRNYVRQRIVPRFSAADRANLLALLGKLSATNRELDAALAGIIAAQPADRLDRQWFTQLPHAVSKEVLAAWLRGWGVRDFDSKTLERLTVAGKTAPPGKLFPVRAGVAMQVHARHLALGSSER